MSELRELMVDESALATTTCISASMMCIVGVFITWMACLSAGLTACLSPLLCLLACVGGGGGQPPITVQ